MHESERVTALLSACARGQADAFEQLLPLVYQALRRLARSQLGRERVDHTLQPTALVHEAWMKLVGQEHRSWEGRHHFLSVAALAMRRVLLHHAEARRALKRGGERPRVALDSVGVFEQRGVDLLALDESLKRLEAVDPRLAKVVELRFFGGLSVVEAAAVLETSERTVERSWRLARAWLRRDLEGGA